MPPTAPAVQCSDCGFTWNSPAMAAGLRLLSTCPRCGTGSLIFRDQAPAAPTPDAMPAAAVADGYERAPHLVLGVPRR